MAIMITGTSGFIGTNFVNYWQEITDEVIHCIDRRTAFNILIKKKQGLNQLTFDQLNIGNKKKISTLLNQYQPRAIIHLAAETHVDKSIENPKIFIENNIVATFQFIQNVLLYWKTLPRFEKNAFRFLYVSTDEVFGSLGFCDPPMQENAAYQPNNPYSATKAAADHLLRAWHHTFQFPSIITHSTNNYGPFQSPEKLIPKTIMKALNKCTIPIYGNGMQLRDWIHVADHCQALHRVLEDGRTGETYNIGANDESTNLDIVKQICIRMNQKIPCSNGQLYETLIKFVKDRPGHDSRYALNVEKIKQQLKWKANYSLKMGLNETIDWYLMNNNWLKLRCNL